MNKLAKAFQEGFEEEVNNSDYNPYATAGLGATGMAIGAPVGFMSDVGAAFRRSQAYDRFQDAMEGKVKLLDDFDWDGFRKFQQEMDDDVLSYVDNKFAVQNDDNMSDFLTKVHQAAESGDKKAQQYLSGMKKHVDDYRLPVPSRLKRIGRYAQPMLGFGGLLAGTHLASNKLFG